MSLVLLQVPWVCLAVLLVLPGVVERHLAAVCGLLLPTHQFIFTVEATFGKSGARVCVRHIRTHIQIMLRLHLRSGREEAAQKHRPQGSRRRSLRTGRRTCSCPLTT